MAGFVLLLSGCAVSPTEGERANLEPEPVTADSGPLRWWKFRFVIHWPAETKPAWHVDALIANELLGPIIERNRPRIRLWRFHRRAARDKRGHQFSYFVYTSAGTATALRRAIAEAPLLAHLIQSGVVASYRLDDTSAPKFAAVAATSGKNWDPVVRESWPWFIQGVSETWLQLIHAIVKRAASPKDTNVEELLARYQNTNATVNATWREQGQHAYLHHLNALFGYQPVRVRESNLKRF